MSDQAFPDLSEKIRLELERITHGKVLRFDDDDDDEEQEDEDHMQLSAQLEDNTLTLTTHSLPEDWGVGKEIMLNGIRFCPVLVERSNNVAQLVLVSPSSKKRPMTPKDSGSPRKEEKVAVSAPVTPDKENSAPSEAKAASSMRRRKSQDLTNQIEDMSSGFLEKLTRHGTYVERWVEIDVPHKSFNYWKTRAVRNTVAPTMVAIADIVSVQWNAKDIKEGKRRNMIGLGGARFVIVTERGSTTWRAKDPLLAIRWIDGLQDLMEPGNENSERGVQPDIDVDEKSGPLQRMNKAGRYKDRWCHFDAKKKTLSYWAKKSLWEAKRPPKGIVNFSEVSAVVWNPEDVRKGKRRSLLSKDGVRFAIHFNDQSVQQWRSDNPLEASEWSKVLASVHCKILARSPAIGKA